MTLREMMTKTTQSMLAVAFMALPTLPLSAQSRTCHTANDTSANVIKAVNAMMTPEAASLRSRFGVALVSSSQITLVTDANVCARAGQALDSLALAWAPTQQASPPNSDPLYVVQLGSDYAVVDPPNTKIEHYGLILYFSAAWVLRTMLTF